MILREIYDYIDSFAPFSTQCDFDNAGFLVGNESEELSFGVVALDVTNEAIDFAESVGANLIVTHHPVIFEGLKCVKSDSLVYRLIKSGISVISAHTNLDMAKGGINDTLCEILGLQNVSGVLPEDNVFAARIGNLSEPLTPDEFGAAIQMNLSPASIKYVKGRENIVKVAVCSGSGGSMLNELAESEIQAFVTADVKHNLFLEASRLGISLYDCGHFDTEDIIVSPLTARLNEKFGNKFHEFHSEIIKTVALDF